jgi:hypothetical protein
MQVTPLPVPAVPTNLPQETAARSIAPVLAQATTPVTQRAVDPSSKSERNQQSRSNGDKAKGGGSGGKQLGGSVNLRV